MQKASRRGVNFQLIPVQPRKPTSNMLVRNANVLFFFACTLMRLGALNLAMWFFQFGKKMVIRLKYMMGKKTMKKSQKVKKNDSRENSVQRKINSMS